MTKGQALPPQAQPVQPTEQQLAAMMQVASLTQPVQFRTQTIVVNGKNMVMVEISRPADVTSFAVEPKQLMDIAQHLLKAGREALTGLIVPSVNGGGVVLEKHPGA